MNCADCELLLVQGETNASVEVHLRECAPCGMLAADLAANTAVFAGLRSEELPRLAVKIPRRRWVYGSVAAAAAAVFALALLLPRTQRVPAQPAVAKDQLQPPAATQTPNQTKIKMLTADPHVVIYWLIDDQN